MAERNANGTASPSESTTSWSDAPSNGDPEKGTTTPEPIAPAAATPDNGSDAEKPLLVDWDSPEDPDNPMNWTSKRKWITIVLVSFITFITSFASTLFAPSVSLLMKEFHSTSKEMASFVVSVYIIGFCLGPLVFAPLSELYGRNPIMHFSNVFFLIFNIASAVSTNLGMFTAFRLLMGIAACPPLTLGGGTIADIMPPSERGKAMSIWTLGPLMGPVLGPIVGGYLAEGAGWRWVFWLVAIAAGILTVLSFFLLRETYAPAILKKKAEKLRKETGNPLLKSKFETTDKTPRQVFKNAIMRPTKMLCTSPIIFILALDMSIVYSYLYFLFTTFPYVFQKRYNFSVGESGLAYLGLGVGFMIGQLGIGAVSDKLAKKSAASAGGEMKPEYRLNPTTISSFLIPAGLLWYGWSVEKGAHWIVPIIGTSLIGIGTMCAFLPIQLYLIDAFTVYAASAIATNTVVRSMFGATLPLAGRPLYSSLGYGWGNTLLAFIALSMAPVHFLLLKYGERIRTNPRFQVKL